jgi:uncharacterized protein (TIGR01777 family)
MKIVIAGGTGFLGGILRRQLANYQISLLVRRPLMDASEKQVLWDAKSPGDWQNELDGADAVINLCGRSVNCRYNAANKAEIYESRLEPTRLIGEAIAKADDPPKLWLNASSATIYRHSEDKDMDEETGEIGSGFSVDVCQKWESALFEGELPKTRRVAMRTSMVMGKDAGGPFEAFANLARRGLGGPMAGGHQYMSWIHEDDFVRAVEFLIEHEELSGPVNLASPNPLPNEDFMAALRQAVGSKFGFASPRWALKLGAMLLGTEVELLVKSRRVVPTKLLDAGFQFRYPTWSEAVSELTQ